MVRIQGAHLVHGTVTFSNFKDARAIVLHSISFTARLSPFIDMANNTRGLVLLGGAVSGLTAVVKDQHALELCTREAFTAFEAMLRAGGYNVLRPLVQLLSELTMEIKAMPFFVNRKFWEAMLDVVTGEETCGELQTHFARLVLSALACATTNRLMCCSLQ